MADPVFTSGQAARPAVLTRQGGPEEVLLLPRLSGSPLGLIICGSSIVCRRGPEFFF